MPEHPYLQWPVFRRSVVAAFQRSLTRNDRFETVACALVVVPVALGWPIRRSGTPDRASDGVDCQVEMAPKKLV